MNQPSVTIPAVVAYIAGALAFIPTIHSLFAAILNRKTPLEVILFDTLLALACFGLGIYSFKLPLTIDILVGAVLAGGALLFVARSPSQNNRAKTRWSVAIIVAFALTIVFVLEGANFAPSSAVTVIPRSTLTASPILTPLPDVTPLPVVTPPPVPTSTTYAETAGGIAHTWTNYTNASGVEGPTIANYQTVRVSCRVTGFKVADGNTWWYRIASNPWNNAYYASADAFFNNGQASGSLVGTPWVDPLVPIVPNC